METPNISKALNDSFAKAIENIGSVSSLSEACSSIGKGVEANFGRLSTLGKKFAPILSNLYSASGKFIETPYPRATMSQARIIA